MSFRNTFHPIFPQCGGTQIAYCLSLKVKLRYPNVTDLCFSLIRECYIAIILQISSPLSLLANILINLSASHLSPYPFDHFLHIQGLYAGRAFCPPFITPFSFHSPVPPSIPLSTECDNTGLIPLFSQSLC